VLGHEKITALFDVVSKKKLANKKSDFKDFFSLLFTAAICTPRAISENFVVDSSLSFQKDYLAENIYCLWQDAT
jgi:hypothetical protein